MPAIPVSLLTGWEAWEEEWDGGYDQPFFRRLAQAFGGGGPLAALNAQRVAFRGFSGSAQMVSWLFELSARGSLPGFNIGAGVFMAGGSYACYGSPGRGSCAHCNSSDGTQDPAGLGCSTTAAERGLAQPYCQFCCPTNFTEEHYESHSYASHPASFLIQTEFDSGADSCAARHYHEAMRANGATSELHIVPLDQQRCYSVGNPGDPTVPVADRRFQRFCSNRSLTSINHTMGFSSMVEPLTRFLLRTLVMK